MCEGDPQTEDETQAGTARASDQPLEADAIAEGEGERDERVQVTQSVSIQRFEGPLPSPDHTKEYEQILPGFSDRHVTMVEEEQANRHLNDRRAFEIAVLEIKEASKRLLIQRIASILLLSILGAFALLLAIFAEQPEIGGGIIIAEVVGVALNTLFSRRSRRSRDDDGD